jgi:hypothetical protein
MQLQRSEAGGIVGHIKCRAQRIVVLRQLAERGHFAFAASRRGFGFQLCGNRVNIPVGGRGKNVWQFGLPKDVDHEDDQDEREKSAGNFQHASCATPAAAFLIVENWLAFRHSDNPS